MREISEAEKSLIDAIEYDIDQSDESWVHGNLTLSQVLGVLDIVKANIIKEYKEKAGDA